VKLGESGRPVERLREPRGTTFVLVGGTMTLIDGSEVDSRQPTTEPAVARALNRALVATPEWWVAVSSVVLPTLDDGHGGYALLNSARTVARVAADGEARRSSIKSVLRGGVGKVSVRRSGPGVNLPAGYREIAILRNWQGAHMGAVGFRVADEKARWQLLDGTDFYLGLVASRMDARVLIDTTGELVSALFCLSDLGSLSDELSECEPVTHLQVVLLPDTVETRTRVEATLTDSPCAPPADVTTDFAPAAPRDPDDYLKLGVLRTECFISGLWRDGRWEDPAGLEAARVLVRRRFDLRLGLWDLALNPILRTTLLDPVPVSHPPHDSFCAPAQARKRAVHDADKATIRKRESRRAIEGVVSSLRVDLASEGWTVDGGQLNRPLTKPLSNWPDAPKHPLVVLRFEVNKAEARVVVWQWFCNDLDVTAFVNERRAAFEAVTPLPTAVGDASSAQLWSAATGWGDPMVNWSIISKELARCTGQWVALLADFVSSCRDVRHARFSRR